MAKLLSARQYMPNMHIHRHSMPLDDCVLLTYDQGGDELRAILKLN